MNAPPVRGTQSFVHVMAEVLRRPSLTALEVLWRWVFWIAVLAWPAAQMYPQAAGLLIASQAAGVSSFAYWAAYPFSVQIEKPLQAIGFVSGLVAVWLAMSALGRKFLLHRLDRARRASFSTMFAITALRWAWWAFVVSVWMLVLRFAVHRCLLVPPISGGESEWVPFFALEISVTLALFLVWLGTSWLFGLASVYASVGQAGVFRSIRAAWRSGPVRGKVAEINLVMGIVKIALLVLALVFSACPLPFQSVESQGFLAIWTAGVLVLYFIASDYFHVVRLMAFLRMTEVLDPLPAGAAAHGAATAS